MPTTTTPPSTREASVVRRRLELVAAFLPLAVVLALLPSTGYDFRIYRGAMLDVLHGGSAYTFSITGDDGAPLTFVYPPFASLVLLPLALVPETVGRAALALLTSGLVLAALASAVAVVDARRAALGRASVPLLLCVLASLPLAVSTPALSNMTMGQISFAVAAVVILDTTLLPRRWRGVLVGVMGAIKLTPLILVPYFLVTRQWRAAANAAGVFAVATLLGALLRWSDTLRYWFHPETVRAAWGTLGRSDNWSEYGVLSRLGLHGTGLTVAWLVLAAATVVVALWSAWRHHRASRELEAILVMGLAAGLVTSATWPHHLLFLVVGGVLLAVQRPALGLPVVAVLTVGTYAFPYYLGFGVVALMLVFVLLGFDGARRTASAPGVTPSP